MAMINKNKLLLLIFFIGFIQKSSVAQISIIPELSDAYVEKLINTAKENYPRIKSFQTRVKIAEGNVSQKNISFFDAFTVSYVYQPGQATIDPTNPSTSYFKGLQAGVFMNLGTLLAKPAQVKQAKQELLIAHNEQDEYLLTLTNEVKKRYFTYVLRMSELKLLTKSTQDVESSLKDIRFKFEKGEETYDNYNKAQIQFTTQQATKLQAEANFFIARGDLEEILGTKLENVK